MITSEHPAHPNLMLLTPLFDSFKACQQHVRQMVRAASITGAMFVDGATVERTYMLSAIAPITTRYYSAKQELDPQTGQPVAAQSVR